MPRRNPPPDKPIVEDLEDLDPFSYIFGEDFDSENDVVSLNRIEPAEWRGTAIKGYLCDLAPGQREPFIQKNYGGGKYCVLRRSMKTGRIVARRFLDISGEPLTKPDLASFTLEEEPAGGAPLELDINGVKVPFSGDLHEFQKIVLFTKAVEAAFPPKPDINSALLELALRRQEPPNMIEQIRELKEAADLFGDKGATAGSTGWDLARSVIEQAGSILGNLTKNQTSRPFPVGPIPGRLPGPAAGSTPGQIEGAPMPQPAPSGGASSPPPAEPQQQPPHEESLSVNEREIVFQISNQLVKGFRLSPPQSPAQVVNLLDLWLQQKSQLIRQGIRDRYAETVKTLCEAELADDWADPDCSIGNREAFSEWIGQIFDLYTAERELPNYE